MKGAFVKTELCGEPLHYEITQNQLQKLKNALSFQKPAVSSIHPLLKKAEMDALQSIIDELSQTLDEYNNIQEEDWGGNGDYAA